MTDEELQRIHTRHHLLVALPTGSTAEFLAWGDQANKDRGVLLVALIAERARAERAEAALRRLEYVDDDEGRGWLCPVCGVERPEHWSGSNALPDPCWLGVMLGTVKP